MYHNYVCTILTSLVADCVNPSLLLIGCLSQSYSTSYSSINSFTSSKGGDTSEGTTAFSLYWLTEEILKWDLEMRRCPTWLDPPEGLRPKMAFYTESTCWCWETASLFDPHTHYDTGCTRLGFPWANFEWTRIGLKSRPSINFHKRKGYISYVTCRRPRRRSILFYGALSSTRYEVRSTTSLGCLGTISLSSFSTQTRGVWLCLWERHWVSILEV